MKILVDENIPNITVHELRAMQHDVLDIRGTERQGMFDDEIWPFAHETQRGQSIVSCSIPERNRGRSSEVISIQVEAAGIDESYAI